VDIKKQIIGIMVCIAFAGLVIWAASAVSPQRLNSQILAPAANAAVNWIGQIGIAVQKMASPIAKLFQFQEYTVHYNVTTVSPQSGGKQQQKRTGQPTSQTQNNATTQGSNQTATPEDARQTESGAQTGTEDKTPAPPPANSGSQTTGACNFTLTQSECAAAKGTWQCNKVYDITQPSHYAPNDSCKCFCPKATAGVCLGEGATNEGGSCCSGLTAIDRYLIPDNNGACGFPNKYLGKYFICSKCGDGICNAVTLENKCNCPQDCK
jgi:hypothetical protein